MSAHKSSPDVLEQNVGSLLGASYDPPVLDPAARSQIRRKLIAAHGKTRAATSPLVAVGFGLAAAAGVAVVAGALLGRDHRGGAGSGAVRDGQNVALADGSTAVLDQGAAIDVLGPRHVRVRGAALLDVTPGKGPFTVETANGKLAVLGTRFVVDASAEVTLAAVIRGQVRLDYAGANVLLRAGEQGVARDGKPPVRGPAPRLSHLASWARTARKQAEDDVQPVRNGTLFARETALRPGQTESDREYPLPLGQLTVDAVVDHQVARVALDQTFENPRAQDLEGVYRFAIPPDAALQRFAMYNDGKLTESAVVDRMGGRRIYEELVYHRVDPGLVEWAGAGRLAMRVYPVRAQSDKRIVLAYTQSLARLYDDWTLTVPLPEVDGSVNDVVFNVRVKGCAGCELHSPSHKVDVSKDGDDAIVSYHGHGETIGDSLVLIARDARKDTQVATHTEGDHEFLAVRARPDLGAAPQGDHRQRTWVVVDDVSASRGTLERRAQADIVASLLRELDEDDKVAVLTVDSIVRGDGKLTRVDDVDAKAVRKFLTGDDVGGVGATDLGAAFDRATSILQGVDARDAYVVYLGDGVVTGGDRSLADLRDKLRGKATFVGVGVGDGADTPTLAALADATGGSMYSIDLADDLAWKSFDLVASLYTARVTGVKASLLDAAGAVIPGEAYLRAGQLGDGEELELVARVAAKTDVAAVDLIGTRDGVPWHSRISTAGAIGSDGAYLPRLWAQRQIAALMLAKEDAVVVPPCTKQPCASEEDLRIAHREDIRKQVVELGKQYFLLSRHTSLLVLENDAMYKQFGITPGSGETWAPYALPATVAVKHVAATSAPGIDPVAALVRTPIATFYDYSGYYKQQKMMIRRNAGWDDNDAMAGTGTGSGYGLAPSMVATAMAEDKAKSPTVPAATSASASDQPDEANKSYDGDESGADSARISLEQDLQPLHEKAAKADWKWDADEERAEGQTVDTRALDQASGEWMVAARKRSSGHAMGGMRGRSDASYRWYGSGQAPYPIAFNSAQSAQLDDLTEFVPALFPGPVDATIDDLDAAAGGAKGSVSAAARALITKARAALPDGAYKLGDGPSITTRGGALAWRSTDDNGLEELARLDGTSWHRAYPELGLEVVRELDHDAAAVALTYLPVLVPDADQLAASFAVTTQGAHTLVLAAAAAADKPIMTIALDDHDRVVSIKTGAGTELLAVTWGVQGPTAATVRGTKTPIAFSTTLDPVAIPTGMVPVTLPLAQPAAAQNAVAAATTGTPAWRTAQRQVLAAAAALHDTSTLMAVYTALRDNGGVELGDAVLASGSLAMTNDATFTKLVAPFGADPATRPMPVRYLAAAHVYETKGTLAAIAPQTDAGLVGTMWHHRQVLALLAAGKSEPAVAALEAMGERGPALREIAAAVIAQSYNTAAPLKARAWDAVAKGDLRNTARYEAARALYAAGDYVGAADRFAALMAEIDLAADPISVDYYAQATMQLSPRGQAGFEMAWRGYATRVLADGNLDHVIALTASAAQLGRTADLDKGLGRIIELANGDRATLIDTLAMALDFGQTERATALLPIVSAGDPDPTVERLGVQLALAQGKPDEAADHLQKAIDASPGPAPLSSVRADFSQLIALRGRVAQLAIGAAKDTAVNQVLATSRQWREIDPANAQIDQQVGELLLDLDRPEEAMRQLSTAIERNPLEGSGWILVADTLERHAQYDQALATWQEAVVIDQTNPGPRLRKAQLLYALGRSAEADTIVKDAATRKWHDRFWNDAYQLQSLARQRKLIK